jgi:hypothetical protein
LVTERLDLEVNRAATSLAAMSRLENNRGLRQQIVIENRKYIRVDKRRDTTPRPSQATRWARSMSIGAPKSSPTEIIDRLNKRDQCGALSIPRSTHGADLDVVVFPGSPSAFGRLVAKAIKNAIHDLVSFHPRSSR